MKRGRRPCPSSGRYSPNEGSNAARSVSPAFSTTSSCSTEEVQRALADGATRLFIIRHAEHVDPTCASLSKKGSLQASALAVTLRHQGKFAAVYASQRCKETASEIAARLCLDVKFDSRLRNWEAGVVAGLSPEEVKETLPEVYQKRFIERRPDFKVPKGESLKERYDRVCHVLSDVVKAHPEEQVILVTHGGIIDDMYRHACSTPLPQLTGLLKPYGCVSVLLHCDNKWRDEQWAGVDHLPQVVAESPSGGQLYLFPHQVAGSFPMLRGDRGELCKPATKKELLAYSSMNSRAPAMLPFVPKYFGTVEIDVNHIIRDKFSFNECLRKMGPMPEPSSGVASGTKSGSERCEVPPPQNTTQLSPSTPSCKKNRSDIPGSIAAASSSSSSSRQLWESAKAPSPKSMVNAMRRAMRVIKPSSFDSAVPPNSNRHAATSMKHSPVRYPTLGSPHSLVPEGKQPFSVTNLWARFTQKRWKKVMKSADADGRYVYLILENLAHGMALPHILDLKMGTQQHNPHESAEKQERKSERCAATTSASCGMRICGIQMHNKKEKRYLLKDKYWGRSLGVQGLKGALREFMLDGSRLRTGIVEKLIDQIERLILAVSKTNLRFYGSSLLVIYDGDAGTAGKKRRRAGDDEGGTDNVDSLHVKLIDFTHIAVVPPSEGPDKGLLFGLQSLRSMYADFLRAHLLEIGQPKSSLSRRRSHSDTAAVRAASSSGE